MDLKIADYSHPKRKTKNRKLDPTEAKKKTRSNNQNTKQKISQKQKQKPKKGKIENLS